MKDSKSVNFDIKNWQKLTLENSINFKFLFQLLPLFKTAKEDQNLLIFSNTKKQIGKEMGWGEEVCLKRCSTELNKLRNLGIITRLDQSLYQLNPNYIGIGENKEVEKLKEKFEIKEPRKKITIEKSDTAERINDQFQGNSSNNNLKNNYEKKNRNKNKHNRYNQYHNSTGQIIDNTNAYLS